MTASGGPQVTEPSDFPSFARTSEQVLGQLGVHPEKGLSADEITSRRARYGENRLPETTTRSFGRRVLSQFADPLVGTLLVAAAVAALVASSGDGDASWADALAILLIVVLNAVLGLVQEARAERALLALKRLAPTRAKVVRGGKVQVVNAVELVPGDIVQLEAGDAVPADLRLVDLQALSIDEATLTGESAPVIKSTEPLRDAKTMVAERINMAFQGTAVTKGSGVGVVTSTGESTEVGRIGALLGATEKEQTPLELHLAEMGRLILVACLVISAFVVAIGLWLQTTGFLMLLLTAVSLAVAAIPEGLLAITTITLALGMQRMAARGAVVRRLLAVETLGSATVICSDKTGTLTQNRMVAKLVHTASDQFEVEHEDPKRWAQDRTHPGLSELLVAAVICNDARIASDSNKPEDDETGDPTELALLHLARRAGHVPSEMRAASERLGGHAFDSDRKRMSVLVRREGGARSYVKGAPGDLLDACRFTYRNETVSELDDAERTSLRDQMRALASGGLRVLGFGYRDFDAVVPEDAPELESDLVFLGFVALHDPPRPSVARSIEECHSAGIRVVMITGDHALTAQAIAQDLALWHEGARTLRGVEIEAMDDEALAASLDDVAVFARVTAEQKLRIVRAFSSRGEVVGMTGDGVNDAPALTEAPIGIAMGRTGTEVARSAADMVLMDDNFSTIVDAIREGRAIFANIRKFVFFLGSSNAGLVLAVVVGSFMPDLPQLLPLQLLWINLVTNGLPALALGLDPTEPSLMSRPPRARSEGVIRRQELIAMLLVGILMGGLAVLVLLAPGVWPDFFDAEAAAAQSRTMAFHLLAISPLFHAHSCRSEDASIFSLGVFSNRLLWVAVTISAGLQLLAVIDPLHGFFHTTDLRPEQWAITLLAAALPVPLVEIAKVALRSRRRATRGRRAH